MRIAHAHNTRLPKDAKLPIKWFCKQFIPGAATDYWACGREAGIYYFGQSAWDARGVTLRNAIDLDRFGYRPQVRAKLRAEYGLNDKLVVGCVARLMAQKNHTRLLDIFAALKKVRPDSCLLLVGEGELRAELEAKAARLGIAQDVKFLGVQSDTSVWYQAMDVFVMPSLFEGLPVVGMEAQASGLPCVFSTGVTEEVLLRPDLAGTAGRSMGRSAEGCGPQSARPCAGGGTGAGCRVRHPAGDPAPAAAVHRPDRQKGCRTCLRSV